MQTSATAIKNRIVGPTAPRSTYRVIIYRTSILIDAQLLEIENGVRETVPLNHFALRSLSAFLPM